MTVGELLGSIDAWTAAHGTQILVGAVALPVVGTVAARIGKGGRTDRDGRAIASVAVGIALVGVLLEVILVLALREGLDREIVDMSVPVLAAPLVCLAGCLLGMRMVFPLSELASFRTFIDIGAFAIGCLVAIFLISHLRIRVLFFGTITEMIVIGILGWFLMRRLYRRAVGPHRSAASA